MRATSPVQLILLHLTILITLVEDYTEIKSFLIKKYFPPYAYSYSFCPRVNIPLNTLFSDTLNLCLTLGAIDQVS